MTQENRREFIVNASDAPMRLDRFLANSAPQFSRSRIQRLIRDGLIAVNGSVPRARDLVRPGDRIILLEPAVQPIDLLPEEISLAVLYEDADLIVLNKRAGISVHPGAGRNRGTLVNALLAHCKNLSGIGGKERPGIVHRLDKDTSGCVVVAKNDVAHLELSRQFAARTVDKIYLALVAGKLRNTSGTIVAAIARDRVHRKKMTIARSGGREAKTDFKAVRSGQDATLLECRLHSGRTHQLRVHLKHLGHPILGDCLYGGRRSGSFCRQMLHAWKLGFDHPHTKTRMHFEAPVPQDFEKAMGEVLD